MMAGRLDKITGPTGGIAMAAASALLVFAMVIGGCSARRQTEAAMAHDPLLARFKAMYVSPAPTAPLQPAAAAWVLRRAGLPPAFWANVANTAPHGSVRFRVAVLVLFTDYLRKGMTLGQFSQVLDGATWLRAADIVRIRSQKDTLVNLERLGKERRQPIYAIEVGARFRPKKRFLGGSRSHTSGSKRASRFAPPWGLRDTVLFTTSPSAPTKEVYAALRGGPSAASAVRFCGLGLWIANSEDRRAILNQRRRLLRTSGPSLGRGGPGVAFSGF